MTHHFVEGRLLEKQTAISFDGSKRLAIFVQNTSTTKDFLFSLKQKWFYLQIDVQSFTKSMTVAKYNKFSWTLRKRAKTWKGGPNRDESRQRITAYWRNYRWWHLSQHSQSTFWLGIWQVHGPRKYQSTPFRKYFCRISFFPVPVRFWIQSNIEKGSKNSTQRGQVVTRSG